MDEDARQRLLDVADAAGLLWIKIGNILMELQNLDLQFADALFDGRMDRPAFLAQNIEAGIEGLHAGRDAVYGIQVWCEDVTNGVLDAS